ncbi:MFS transporter [Rubrimonas cliftonensis]|uniref:Predicted arabinose efflux permease, MFS family n=1 Tax=Rubrimonas cliftonensis TaxID=89524 RepID=A0A1H4E8W4_9RHOB|nr:MFS transporter [Rubrimonas cliftonensis]SEA81010.1 Predicted arabinose efflux permease, MFS family [Rubrimonas cliftonensis]
MAQGAETAAAEGPRRAQGPGRAFVAAVAFLTLVDLFATQAIIPALTVAYGVTPAEMGLAVNASTLGMAAASLGVALFGGGVDRRRGVALALALLAVPTALLAVAPDLATFAALRVAQGVCMATAFSLTLTALGELLTGRAAAAAFAAYVTGNVASNLLGRLAAASAAETAGLKATFLLFAALNLAGALMVWRSRHAAPGMAVDRGLAAPLRAAAAHLAHPGLRGAFALGFCVLFAFIGVFTYVNFVLIAPPYDLPAMSLGAVYLVFAPSLLTTPLAGPASARYGARAAIWGGLAVAGAGLAALLAGRLELALAGLVAVGAGTFFAQAAATGYVSRAALHARAAASGLYLAAYFSGGLAGAAALGWAFERFGWTGCVAGVALALAAGALAAGAMRER